MPRGQGCSVPALTAMNRKLLGRIAAHRVPAFGLVTGSRICEGQDAALPAILDMWLAAGHDLGNHSFSHFDLNDTPLSRYEADVIRGAKVMDAALAKRGRTLKYFRHPFLHAGKDLATKRAFEKFLSNSGYKILPVTIDNQEWVFAEAYARAIGRGDNARAKQIADAYVNYMESVFEFFEKLSVDVAGREVKQVLLLHANALNADHFDELAQMMKRRSYTFITVDQALQDPAYRLPDTYAGQEGLSWLHRWAITKGMKRTQEPREPEYILKLSGN